MTEFTTVAQALLFFAGLPEGSAEVRTLESYRTRYAPGSAEGEAVVSIYGTYPRTVAAALAVTRRVGYVPHDAPSSSSVAEVLYAIAVGLEPAERGWHGSFTAYGDAEVIALASAIASGEVPEPAETD